jgi:predicted phage baseplate assembly protein
MFRPLGVKAVTNPLAPNGAADREALNEARSNAPLTVLTLGRVVSLQDYEDFAQAFSGIAKTLATWTWFGERRGIFLTIAGANGAAVLAGSALYLNLLDAIRKAGDPNVRIEVQTYRRRFFRVSAGIKIDEDHLSEKVLSKIEEKLRQSFSFESRAFGQPVSQSEIIASIQAIEGVVAVDVNEFYRTDQSPGLNPRLEAAIPRSSHDAALAAAELLTLDPRPVGLEVIP